MKVSGEWRWVLLASLGIVFLASIPYLFGYAIVPQGHRFIGLTRNVDDALVYLSWMRQAADGAFFTRNLFTTEPQAGRGFNLLFLALGRFAGVTHLPLIAVFHLARVFFGAGLLMLIYAFARLWTPDVGARRLALLIAGLSSGLGFLWPAGESLNRPVDLWQPEAITFLSIYLSPLFSFSLVLMLGSLYLLYLHGTTGRGRYAVAAGLLLLLLGNVHSYDVIPVALTWSAYSAVNLLRSRNRRPATGGLIAAAICAPSVAYQAYIYLHEPVFRLRADVPTLSPPVVFYLLGFGLLIPLAAVGMYRSRRRDCGLLACWILAAFIAAYLPISFQRKLIMGIHIPVSILAGIGLRAAAESLRGRAPAAAAALAILLLVPSNAAFMLVDMNRVAGNVAHTTAHSPLVAAQEFEALRYLRAHSRAGDVVLAQPSFSSLVPACAGSAVVCGHWGETAGFETKLREVLGFFGAEETKPQQVLLRQYKVDYVVDYNQLKRVPLEMDSVLELDGITVYRVAEDR